RPARPQDSSIERRVGLKWELVSGPVNHSDPLSEWGAAFLSPDGRTVLAEWEYPCDGRVSFFIPTSGGTPRAVTGEHDWRAAPGSDVLGWTADGKAPVRVYGRWGK